MGTPVLSKARALLTHLISGNKFDKILSAVEPVGGEAGNVVFEMTVGPEHCNLFNTLHGGCSAYLVDALSTVSQLSLDRPPGVSVEIQTRYLQAAKVGETILIETETQKSGRNLLFQNVLIKNKATGKLLVHGTHTKYIVDYKEEC